jgi:integral membrane sensor domain MASE1
MNSLTTHIGELPTDPKKQNAKWYSLYKMVESLPEVEEAQKNFLMYRDMAVLSFPFIAFAPLVLYFAGATSTPLWFGSGLFACQFLLTALSARWSGIRFVTNVLAIHSSRKVAQPEVHA